MMRDYPPLETNKTRNQKLSRCNNNIWKRLKTPRRFVRQEFNIFWREMQLKTLQVWQVDLARATSSLALAARVSFEVDLWASLEFKVRLYTRRFVVYDCRPGVWKLLLVPNFRWRNYDIIAMNNAGMITTKMFLVFDHYVLTITFYTYLYSYQPKDNDDPYEQHSNHR
jgi:hypothetical protein